MTLQDYINDIKLSLTGGVLELELSDEKIGQIINMSMSEIQRYIDSTELMTVPFASCIDLKDSNVSSVSRIFRTRGYNGDSSYGAGGGVVDPMYVQTWMSFTNGGTMYNLNDYLLNFMSYNTLLQIRNTTSTDLAFKQDHQAGKLYINSCFDKPEMITIEYIPKFLKVDDIKSDYWIDVLRKLSLAHTKMILGRIRSRYKSTANQWEQDGETILTEGKEELKEIRERLMTNSQMIYPMD